MKTLCNKTTIGLIDSPCFAVPVVVEEILKNPRENRPLGNG